MNSRRVGAIAVTAIGAGLATLAMPAVAQTAAISDFGSQAWQQGQSSGFGLASQTTVVAPAGSYQPGSSATFTWCTPYTASSIASAVVHVTRGQSASPVVVKVGPNPDGSGGTSIADSAIPTGSVGTNVVLGSPNSACVTARVIQTSTATSPARTWSAALSDVSLFDKQGPSVSGLEVHGPAPNGWYTGPVTVLWTSSDNELFRGTTGVEISDGSTTDLGDATSGFLESATVSPGADGPHTITVYRTASGGWPTAEATTTIKVDRTPPSVPQMVAPPVGAFPAGLTTTPSTDGADGSGVARIEFSTDGGATALLGPSLTRPGRYRVQARAVDVAGNVSAWSSAIDVTVPGAASTGSGSTLHLARVAVDGRSPSAQAVMTLTRTFSSSIRIGATLADGLGRLASGARVVAADAHGALARGTTNRAGRIVLTVPVRRSGTVTLSANGGGALIRVVVRMRPLIVLSAHDRHAISGAPLRLGPHRVLAVSGTAAPGGIVSGQPVELEYEVGRIWLPLGLPVPVSRSGRWHLTYAVSRPGSAVVRMRVVMPSQPGLPFAAGASAAFRVAIR